MARVDSPAAVSAPEVVARAWAQEWQPALPRAPVLVPVLAVQALGAAAQVLPARAVAPALAAQPLAVVWGAPPSPPAHGPGFAAPAPR